MAGFAITAVAALGSSLHVAGSDTGVPLPWVAFGDLPLLRYAIPLRFPAFALLAAGLMAAMWLARSPAAARWALALLARGGAPAGVRPPRLAYRDRADPLLLGRRPRAPSRLRRQGADRAHRAHNMYWQTQADFGFALATGYVGAFPQSYTRYAAWRDLLGSPFGARGRPRPARCGASSRPRG